MSDSNTSVFIKLDDPYFSKTISLVINKFLNEIKQDDEKCLFRSPVFEIAGFKFEISVYPQSSPQFIGVFLVNLNDIDIKTSFHVKVCLITTLC